MVFRSAKHTQTRLEEASFATRYMPNGKDEVQFWRLSRTKPTFLLSISPENLNKLFIKKHDNTHFLHFANVS